MFGAEIGQCPVPTDEIKSWRCNHLASRNAVFSGVLRSAEFFDPTPVITRYRHATQNLRTTFLKIIKRAGLAPWPKLIQNLRSTRETELAEEFPLQAVTQWMGNSELIAARHYLQVTSEHFRKAAEPKVANIVANNTREHARTEERAKENTSKNASVFAGVRDVSSECDVSEWAMRDSNRRLHPCKGCTLAN